MSLSRVTSFLQLDCKLNNQSICVKVVENFWDIPPTRCHRPITFNDVLADANGYIALAMMRRRDMMRRLCGVLVPDVVGLVTSVYPLTDVVIDGETIYQLTFEIMDERGTPAFWASVSYSKLIDKEDVVVALLWVNMRRLSDREIVFQSHCDMSQAMFNYNHPDVVDFRVGLNLLAKAEINEDDDSDET
ncbi:hypothetical protein K1719_011886 [Acacia pycnantha]|nr:hypothetical protein K1719_011886 [Acacia pycnantha]